MWNFYYYYLSLVCFGGYEIFLSLPLSFVWFISCLAETNRTPFDFGEGESELVSGFNVEYGGGGVCFNFSGWVSPDKEILYI